MDEDSELRSAELIDLLPCGVLSLEVGADGDVAIRRANPAARSLLGGRLAPGDALCDVLPSAAGAEETASVVARSRRIRCTLRRGDRHGRIAAVMTDDLGGDTAEALRERYEVAAAATEVGVFEVRFPSERLIWDDTMRAIYGVAADHPIAHVADWRALLAPGPATDAALEAQRRARESGGDDVAEVEFDILRPDGAVRRILARSRVIERDASGAPLRLVGANIDVTERRRTEARAERAERRLREALESLSDGFALYDAEDRLVFANARYREIYAASAPAMVEGASFEEIIRFGVARGQYPEATGRETDYLRERVAIHRAADRSFEQALPGDRWLRVVERRTEAGETAGLRVDITDFKRQQAALEAAKSEAEEALQRLAATSAELERYFDLSLDLFVIARGGGRIVKANRAACEVFGLAKSRATHPSIADLAHPDDRPALDMAFARLQRGETVEGMLLRVPGEGGRWRTLEWRWAPGETNAFFGAARDVTEREAALAERSRRAAAEAALARIAAAAHAAGDDAALLHECLEALADGSGWPLGFSGQAAAWLAATEDGTAPSRVARRRLDDRAAAAWDRAARAALADRSVRPGVPFVLDAGVADDPILAVALGVDASPIALVAFRLDAEGPPETELHALLARAADVGALALERRRISESLVSANSRLALTAEMSGAGAWEYDPAAATLRIDPIAARIAGLDGPGPLDPRAALALFAPPARGRLSRAFRACALSGEPFDLELEFDGAARVRRWTRIIGRPTGDGSRPRAVSGVFQDVSKRFRREREAAVARARFEAVFEHTPSLVAMKSREGTFLAANRRFREFFGLNPEDGADPRTAVAPEAVAKFEAIDERAFATRAPMERQDTLTIRGEERALLSTRFLLPGGEDGEEVLCFVATEVTEQVRRERELARARDRFQAIFDNTESAMVLKDRDGRVIDANRVFKAQYGLDDVAGKSTHDLIARPEADAVEADNRRIFETGERLTREVTLDLAQGRKTLIVQRFLIPDPSTGDDVLCAIATDITEQRRREAEAKRARDRFERIFEHSSSAMALKRRDGRFIAANRLFLSLYGLHEIAGLRREAFMEAEQAARLDAGDARTFETRAASTETVEIDVSSGSRVFLMSRFLVPDAETGEDALCLVSVDITEQKRREEEAERARDRFEAIFQQSAVLTFVKRRDGRFVAANRRMLDFVGRDSIEGLANADIYPPEVARRLDAENAAVFASGEPMETTFTLPRPGDARTFILTKFLIPDPETDGVALCGVSVDITEQKRREEEAARARDQVQRIFDNSVTPMFVKNRAGRIVMANRAYLSTVGLDRLDGSSDRDLYDAATVSAFDRVDRRVFETGQPFTGEETTKRHGVTRTYLVSKFLIPNPEDEGDAALCCVATDVTEQRRRETEVAQIRARFEAVFENTDALMFIKRRDGRFIAANRRYLEETRTSDVVGRGDWEFHEAETQIEANDRRVFETGEPFFGEEALTRPDGRRLVYLSSKFLIPDPVLGEQVLCAICTDVSELKRLQVEAEEHRRAAEAANAAKSQFLATMSHEIRTPMNGVIGMADLLSRTGLDPRQTEMLSVIRDSGEVLLHVINDILDFSKIEAGRIDIESAAFDPAAVLRRVVSVHRAGAERAGVTLDAVIAPDPPPARLGDAHRIEQILLNLVSNAIKFAAGGCVSVRIGAEADGPLTLTVADDGIGMNPEQAARVFDRFAQADSSTTRRFGGTGLGLSIVKGLVDAMGGAIAVETREGEGARFTATLPLPLAPSAPTAGDDEVAPGLRVLAADDNPINRAVLGALLSSIGARCIMAETGEEALETARAGEYDLLMLDIAMPGLDGVATLEAIRAVERERGAPHAPAIAVTADADPDRAAALRARGFDRCLPKPLSRESLVEHLRGAAPVAKAAATG